MEQGFLRLGPKIQKPVISNQSARDLLYQLRFSVNADLLSDIEITPERLVIKLQYYLGLARACRTQKRFEQNRGLTK